MCAQHFSSFGWEEKQQLWVDITFKTPVQAHPELPGKGRGPHKHSSGQGFLCSVNALHSLEKQKQQEVAGSVPNVEPQRFLRGGRPMSIPNSELLTPEDAEGGSRIHSLGPLFQFLASVYCVSLAC